MWVIVLLCHLNFIPLILCTFFLLSLLFSINMVSFSHEPMDGFTGAMGEVGIFTIEWDGDTDLKLPEAFVAKCPLDDDIARMYNEVMQYYIRESGFYKDLSPEIDMRIPECWINRFDPETGRAFLLLEYIGHAEKGDILQGCSVEVMKKLVHDLNLKTNVYNDLSRNLDIRPNRLVPYKLVFLPCK